MPISATDLNKAYLAYFGRPADLTGKTYFATLEQADVIKAFDASAESQALYGTDVAAKVNAIYMNLFNREAEPAGLTYWTTLITQGRVTAAEAALSILNGAQGTDATSVSNKLAAATAFVAAMDTTPEMVGYSGMDAAASARTWLKAVNETEATLTAAVAGAQAAVTTAIAQSSGEGGGGFQLTNGTDVRSANVFTSGLVYTPGGDDRINSLQDEDRLTGTGTNPTLNATVGNANDNGATTITPTMTGIETINVAFLGSGATAVNQLDLQDATGVTKAINITRVSDGTGNAQIDNINAVPTNLSLSNSGQPGAVVTFGFKAAAVAGATDSTTLTVDDVQVAGITVQDRNGTAGSGIETLNLVSDDGSNTVGVLTAEDIEILKISGDSNLRLGGQGTVVNGTLVEATTFTTGLANVAGSLTTINAADFTGNLTLNLGAEFQAGADGTSGKPVQLSVTGGTGNDTFRLTGSNVNGTTTDTDRINGGEGTNTLVVTSNSTIAAAGTVAVPVANVTNIQALEVRTGHDAGAGADAVAINADAFDKLATIFIRNEGSNNVAGTSNAEGSTVTFTNLTSAHANAVTMAHGTTGNSTIANNVVTLGLKTSTGAADTAQVTIVDGINTDAVFNANITATAVEKVTLVDSDTESNTVHLNQGAFTQAGSSITLNGGATGQYLSLDSFSAAAVAGAGTAGYGYATDGTATSSTTVAAAAAAIAGVPTTVSTSQRDASVSTVFNGTVGTTVDGATRHLVESVIAGSYAGDVVVRLGDITRANGTSSTAVTTGAGNDTIIFDAIGLTSAGFTSGDTVAGGTGTDTLVIDGNTATIPGTPRVDHQASEWDNVTGIDVLRYGNNAGVANVGNAAQVANAGGAFYARIDNEFITQTDAGNRLTVVNNDGSLATNNESDLVLDLRGLSQTKFVTFVGANGVGNGGISSNRVVLDDVSANSGEILNGGDTDVRITTTGGYVAGNNNVYEVRNTANVSISDLSQTSNFGLINFTNDQAVAQTLTLTLNNTVVEALVDSSNTATSAATQEILNITATDNGAVASALNVDARQLSGFHSLNVAGSAAGNDVLSLNANVGGSANFINLGASAGDRVNWTGGSATTAVTIDMGSANVAAVGGVIGTAAGDGFARFVDAAVTTVHDTNATEIVDLSGLTYASSVINGTNNAETIIGGASADVITGGVALDQLTGGLGADSFVINQAVTGNREIITDFTVAQGDKFSLSNAAFAGSAAAGAVLVVANAVGIANLATNILVDTAANIAGVNQANVRFAYDTTNNTLIFDADGNFGAGTVVIATVTLAGVLAAGNFEMIA